MSKIGKCEQADGRGEGRRARKVLKQRKHRLERRRSKQDPETQPAYNKYKGYLT